ncbi:hypothetical protein Pmani_018226 [Petrolisthes manimaculis]|uniref:Thg1 C-terminal domain-containing protein n=1 Tax=Petrolisthes manimaculis TaxID=1843537 RepID=A0AAE1PLE6_9EUCA|nr:hypothetical protein Pmani_018226 [Petrolisthes manimaculis]
MANSRFEYVKAFETTGVLDPGNWIVVTVRCHNIDLLSQVYSFRQPNDVRFSRLMEASAVSRGGLSPREAEQTLCGTISENKRSILLTHFNYDYDDDKDDVFKKGTVMTCKNPTQLTVCESNT